MPQTGSVAVLVSVPAFPPGLSHVGKIARGFGGEFALAGGGTETIGLAGILGAIRRRIGVHTHPADRVNHAFRGATIGELCGLAVFISGDHRYPRS